MAAIGVAECDLRSGDHMVDERGVFADLPQRAIRRHFRKVLGVCAGETATDQQVGGLVMVLVQEHLH